ncbi:MAG: sulfotransferase family protein, partial [Proteobacteria bacterium]
MGKRSNVRRGNKAADPTRVRELFSRAVDAIRAGDAATGRQLLLKADKLAPGNPAILFNLGYANHFAGRYAESVGFYRRCLDRDPDLVDAWVNLASAAREAGQLDVALRACVETLERRPDDASARNDYANLLVATGKPERALEQYAKALDSDPSRDDTRRNQAHALLLLGRTPEAEQLLREVLQRNPRDDDARMSLVALLDDQNRVDEAESVLDDRPGGPRDVQERLLAGNLRMRQGKTDLAETDYRAVLEKEPGNALALNNLGLVTVYRGNRDEADRLFRAAIAADREFTDPWRNLVALKKYRSEQDPDIRRMRELAARAMPDASRVQIGFALGKALEDCARYDEAFEHYALANALKSREAPFDAAALAQHAERIRDVFDDKFLRSRKAGGSDSLMPVYIVGMPRTGTTLLEQILSAHPSFHGGGELLLVNRLIARLENP